MANPSAIEQLTLEFINQARLDPQGEFDRFITNTNPLQTVDPDITGALNFFNVDLNVYRQQLDALDGVAPLAWNSKLEKSATAHSKLMIANDEQSHNLPGELGLGGRIKAAGYGTTTLSAAGENISAFTESAAHGHAGFFIDWGNTATGIQDPPGHRNSIMNINYTEVGIGIVRENDPGTDVGPFVQTQHLANRSDYQAQIVGVVYNDGDNNDFYSIGEALSGVSVTLSSGATTTKNAGGYNIVSPAGLQTITFSGGGLTENVTAKVLFDSQNVKVDLIDGKLVASSANTTLVSGAKELNLLGTFATEGTGNGAANRITGSKGDNELSGLGGRDTLLGGDGNDTLRGGNGNDILKGDAGKDTLNGGSKDDSLSGGSFADKILGGSGNDTIKGGSGNDKMFGGNQGDKVFGGSGKDALNGEAGNDTLKGEGGADTLHGGGGADRLSGGSGNDRLTGAQGNDTLIGGGSNDKFIFSNNFGADQINDFHAGNDAIDALDFSALNLNINDLTIAKQGSDTLITTPNGDSVLLLNILPGDLSHDDDFLFV